MVGDGALLFVGGRDRREVEERNREGEQTARASETAAQRETEREREKGEERTVPARMRGRGGGCSDGTLLSLFTPLSSSVACSQGQGGDVVCADG
eukprot:3095941-Rhodomonas_salina.1